MELSLLLMEQIAQLFLMLFLGYVLVKTKTLSTKDSKVLSTLVLFVISPCAIINSFSIELTQDKLIGLGLAFLGAVVVHMLYIPLTEVFSKVFGLAPIEKATVIYTNAGNLIIPLVGAVLGKKWVFYTSGYIVVQTILLWTHAKSLVSHERSYDLKKIFLNINVLAIMLGICIFLLKIKLPSLLMSTVSSVGSMIGPLSMIVIGMLIGEMNLKDMFQEKELISSVSYV